MSFKGKVVLLTGGSSGIGAATVIKFVNEGANVAFVGRSEERLKAVAEKCAGAEGLALPIKGDVAIDKELKEALDKTLEKFGRLDILVNNAGILRKADIIDDNYMTAYDEVLNTNMRSVAYLTHIASPHLAKTKGNIINISSIAPRITIGGSFSTYTVSKAAMDNFTRAAAFELAAHGIRVNSVNPGPVPTSIFSLAGVPVAIDTLIERSVLKKGADAEEIADLIAYLASDKAKSITGSSYVIDNGLGIS